MGAVARRVLHVRDKVLKMKYVLISDIHANLPAFRSVAGTFPGGESAILCAGDVVGYGAEPNECVDMTLSLGARCVMGNHDAAAAGAADINCFNEWAKEAVRWTRSRLSSGSRGFLEALPMVIIDDDITVVHGTLHSPEEFMYMDTGAKAMHTFEAMDNNVCFLGHSHVPGFFTLREGKVYYSSYKRRLRMEKGLKYIVNVGSVGQPRDGDNRACYCVYDPERKEVEFRRVEYDVTSARESIIKAGLPEYLGDRLTRGR